MKLILYYLIISVPTFICFDYDFVETDCCLILEYSVYRYVYIYIL